MPRNEDPAGPADRAVLLAGATGELGRAVAGALDDRGLPFVPAGRSARRLRAVTDAFERARDPVVAGRPAGLAAAATDAAVLVSTVGPYLEHGRPLARAAVEAGTAYVDAAAEQPFVAWVHRELDAAARRHGVTAVPGAGLHSLIGDALVDAAAPESAAGGGDASARAVHVAYAVPHRGGMLRALPRGARRSVARLLGRRGRTLVRGEERWELMGEARRLAWFPRPLGPHHAAGIPGGEVVMVPRHLPGVGAVRTYVALPTWQAELLQLAAGAARWQPVRRVLARVLERGAGPDARARGAIRWACVAEVAGAPDDDGRDLARAWAYGHDPYATAAASVAMIAARVGAGDTPPGARAPAELAPGSRLLDELTTRTDLRWSVTRSRAGGPDPDLT